MTSSCALERATSFDDRRLIAWPLERFAERLEAAAWGDEWASGAFCFEQPSGLVAFFLRFEPKQPEGDCRLVLSLYDSPRSLSLTFELEAWLEKTDGTRSEIRRELFRLEHDGDCVLHPFLQEAEFASFRSAPRVLLCIRFPFAVCPAGVAAASPTHYAWNMGEFEKRLAQTKPGDEWDSPPFRVAGLDGAVFNLSVYPRGKSKQSGHASCVYLNCAQFGDRSSIHVHFELWFQDPNANRTYKCAVIYRFKKLMGRGRGLPLALLQRVAGDDPLFMHAEIRTISPSTARSVESPLLPRIARTFGLSKYCDLELRVKGETFKVSKAIVCSSSPFFDRLVSTTDGPLVVVGIKAELMEKILRFIYDGEVAEIDAFAARLFPFAVEYEMPELADVCAESMLRTLRTASALPTLKLVFEHEMPAFQHAVLEFVHANMREIEAETPEWAEFRDHNPRIVGLLLRKAHENDESEEMVRKMRKKCAIM
ncbi:Speckle-type POZ protein A isoform X1 [Aphelenchoides fujianensis]|nr:Speckle-type POZ protein A isoform X1 [Aphelenchoides fujianensis]